MALNVVDEAVRNAVAVGADPDRIAVLDNFCWGDPLRQETLGSLLEAARGCHDAALHFGAPFISGKDSLNNEYLTSDGQRQAIPPTLLISAMGVVQDITRSVTLDLKEADNLVYLLGNIQAQGHSLSSLPLYRAVHQAMQKDLVRACHDLSEGGLAVAAAEMCIAGRLGLSITTDADIFQETNGCLLVEVRPQRAKDFESALAGQPSQRLGVVTDNARLNISTPKQSLLSIPLETLVSTWNTPY
jgi:phosphoribosylformylglycinamidine synthase